jgi:hypothetical protein
VKSAISMALSIKEDVLKQVFKSKSERLILTLTYNPKLPSVSRMIHKHWSTLDKDPKARLIFPKPPPMLAFKQPKNLKGLLCRAKLPNNSHPKSKRCHNLPIYVLLLQTQNNLYQKELVRCCTFKVLSIVTH